MKQLSILFRGTLGFPFPVSGAFALCLLLLASCGGDDSSDEGYAAIESASFTFDETTPANNAVRVIANTGWQVFWTPESAAVRVEPASGSGNGVFYVWDMPKGASVQVGVRAASGKTSGKPVTVTRAADAVGVTLSVAPAELLYDPASPASNVAAPSAADRRCEPESTEQNDRAFRSIRRGWPLAVRLGRTPELSRRRCQQRSKPVRGHVFRQKWERHHGNLRHIHRC